MPKLFGKKKEQTQPRATMIESPLTELEKLCGSDKELYLTLERTLIFRVPPSPLIDLEIKNAVAKAEVFEKDGDKISARVFYKQAGDLAIYKGDLAEVQKYYTKCLEVDPEWLGKSMLEFFFGPKAEKAMKTAEKYYSKFKSA